MKRYTFAFSVAALLGTAALALAADMPGMASPKTAPTSQPTSQPAANAKAVDLGNTVCPVSGDKVADSKLVATYDGKIYHFCCDDCPKAFAKDPAKVAKAVAADPKKYGVKATG